MSIAHHPTLSVDLAALRTNYRQLRGLHAKQNTAAVVKANAYGLGVAEVAKALAEEGCTQFFVATLDEAIELRGVLPKHAIAVFNGIFPGQDVDFAAYGLTPVINDPSQLGHAQDFFLHIDTGMTRLGLRASDLEKAAGYKPRMILSHLACANEPGNPKNSEQLARLHEARKYFPGVPVSFANSSGHFLPADYHFDMGRPGCAIYGINPVLGDNPMRHVATLSAPLLQLRTLDRDETVGYGATCAAKKGARIAVTGMGYSDGYFRSLGNIGHAMVEGHKVPICGRVSMDMISLDVSSVPEGKITENTRAEFINAQQRVDDIARQCDTIGYEVFTRIGRRVKRIYI